MSDFLKTFWQYLVPQHTLSSFMHWLATREWGNVTTFAIRRFVAWFDIDLSEAERERPEDYRHFNDFFTRALKADARPIDPRDEVMVSPADGRISVTGDILQNRLIQAKGHDYTLEALLGGNIGLSEQFRDGQFAVVYLSPRDYHRVHMPIAGTLKSMMYVPGDLFAVNGATVRRVPELFARNERVILHFDSDAGPLVLVLVGAIFVGSMETLWAGRITPPYANTLQYWDYSCQNLSFAKGEEIGRFNMGSTVVMLTQQNALTGLSAHVTNTPVHMGQAIATLAGKDAQA